MLKEQYFLCRIAKSGGVAYPYVKHPCEFHLKLRRHRTFDKAIPLVVALHLSTHVL